jgi:Spy/CpxP family protein refolding chaperone
MEVMMKNLKLRKLIALSAVATITLLFSQNALATTGMDAIGTGSSGSYSYGASKGEGSGSKKSTTHHISGKKGHYKTEGSGSKSYSHDVISKGYSYGHKKPEGNKHKKHGSHSYNKSVHGGHGKHSSKCPFTHLLKYKYKLGLTEAQVVKIKELRFEYQKQSVRNKADHKIAHMEFDKLVHAKNVDAQAIRSAAGKIAGSKTQMIMATAEAKIALLNLLTDEQRSKTQAMHSAHSSH